MTQKTADSARRTSQGARTLTPLDLAGGLPSLISDLPTVLSGLRIVRTARSTDKMSIGRKFQALAAKQPDSPFLRFLGAEVTYGEANRRANRFAEVLKARGVTRGDTVGICMVNRTEVVLAILGAVKVGASVGLLNHHQSGEVLDHSQKILGSKVVLIGAECAEAACSVPRENWVGELIAVGTDVDLPFRGFTAGHRPDELSDLTWLEDELAALDADAGSTNPPEADETLGKETAYYVFTSGTTGLPKASTMTHYRWNRALAGFGLSGVRLKKDDVLLCPLPMYHNNALTVGLGCILASGACLAIEEHFSASKFWDQARAAGATAAIYIGEICRYLLNQEPGPGDRDHSIRVMTGNGLRPEIWTEFQQRFGIDRICEFYAASECNIAFVNAFNIPKTTGYCPMDFAIVDYDPDTGEPRRGENGRLTKVGRGKTGLLISGISDSQPFDGYTDKEATEKKVVRDAFADGDAWFVSGDLMLNQGLKHASFVDRLGDTFRWKGENVATTEVESAISARTEVDQAVVYGVPVPGADGKAGMAAVRLHDKSDFDGAALAEHLRGSLPSYAVPLFIRLSKELEHTSTYKSRKTELREQAFDTSKFDEPLYVLSKEKGYIPFYDGAENDVVAGSA
ncbi:long-chain-acyl-CoA synthetase [Rhodococcus sp. IEGM 1408]|uniref:long-chain-acyl-CoA synthetase n=1 Tax=Rhodococcus sp. IEGM 1408 TaxID=3082220 RepID=UPI0029540656|nr:long-chain-acyl-CoA synthetase [Rhodococcus sp. IEGM 1408]MDV7999714.1 long-chain-acyl-CoA synthetase [Rhodococcus sp. IEGM 1408]